MHEIRALHERYVSEVEVAQYLVLEAASALLVRTRQVESARVAPQTFLVIVVVIVQGRRL